MMSPVISVIIPTHNRPLDCFNLVSQFSNFDLIEVIVVENGSDSEHKKEYKRLFASNQLFVKLELTSLNGAPSARNFGASLSSGEYLWFVDDDEYIAVETVAALLESIQEDCYDFNDIFIIPFVLSSNSEIVVNSDIEKYNINNIKTYGHVGNATTIVMKRDFFDNIGRWDESLIAGQDTDLFLSIFEMSPTYTMLSCMPVIIRNDFRSRITTSPMIQTLSKIQFLSKNWRRLHPYRVLRYLVSFVLFVPYVKYFFNYVSIKMKGFI